MAPEVLRGRPVTPAADVYAVGLVLYRMLTGAHPFADCDTVDAMWMAHLTEMPPLPSTHLSQGLPTALDRVVMRALAKEPPNRFANATELAAALARTAATLARSDGAQPAGQRAAASPAVQWPTTQAPLTEATPRDSSSASATRPDHASTAATRHEGARAAATASSRCAWGSSTGSWKRCLADSA